MSSLFKSVILIFMLSLLAVTYLIYRSNTYVTAEFKNLRPFHTHAPIYLNGFKIGRVIKVRPNKNYTSSIVTMELHPHGIKLPINVTANLKKEKDKYDNKFDYIDIIYPKDPSIFYLKDGDKISGKSSIELESYLANQDPESLDAIKADLADTIKNLNITIQTLGDLFQNINSLVSDVKPNVVQASSDLKTSSTNLVKISENTGNFTRNINTAISEELLNETAENIKTISSDAKNISGDFSKASPQIGCTITQINRVLCNIEEMTAGLNCTMKKSFGGLRLLFGSPICKKK